MTVDELLQIEEIRQLRVRYSHCFDGKRLDDLVDLFTEDAVCEFGPDFGGDWVGKARIRERYARYMASEGPEFGVLHAVTNHDVTLVDLFTDDAVCEFGPDFGGDWVGKTQIRAHYARFLESEGPEFAVMHAVTNHDVRLIDATTALGRSYLLDLRTTEGVANPLILFGVYDDLYKKVAGAWKIHRTRIDFLWPKRRYLGPRKI